jgi:hypothetical protein
VAEEMKFVGCYFVERKVNEFGLLDCWLVAGWVEEL